MIDDRTDLLVRVAELYYQQELNQNEIAKILGTSRTTVSRLLDEAKETGVVEIIVHSPVRKDAQLSYTLRTLLGLRDAIVVSGTYDEDKALEYCCVSANQFLGTILTNNTTVGITWGAAMQKFCEVLTPRELYNVNVVQMVGCLGTGDPSMDGLELAIRISRKLGGTYSNIYAPIYVENELVHSYLVRENQIMASLRRASQTDIVVTGIGSLDSNTSLQKAGYFTDRDRMFLRGKGAAAHILARPIDHQGNEIPFDGHYVVGAPLSAMKAAQWTIGIAVSEVKAEAAVAACRGGYINTLVVDQVLANKAIELIEKEGL